MSNSLQKIIAIFYPPKTTNKDKFTCCHAHDYSAIELNGETYIEIVNNDDMEDTDTEGTVLKVERIVDILNNNNQI